MALAAHSTAYGRSTLHATKVCSQGPCALSRGWGACRRPRPLVLAAASPWEDMNREFAALDRQFAAMDKEFADMDQQFADMTRQFNSLDGWGRQVDQDLSEAMQRTQSALAARRQQLQLELDRQQQQQQQGVGLRAAPGTVVFEGTESGAGAGAGTGFSYYRTYTLSIQTDAAPSYLPPPAVSSAPVSPLVLVAALIASVHVAVTATFVKNFHHTTYAPKWRLGLSLAWPALAAFNSKFRQQFVCALKGQRAPVLKSQDGQDADGQSQAAEARPF